MIRKHVWQCNGVLTALSLLSIVSLSAMENNNQENGIDSYCSPIEQKGKKVSNELFHGYLPEQLEDIYQHAPEGVKLLVKRLENPHIVPAEMDIRARFFIGEPGTGKTMTAIMLAYKLGWSLVRKRATDCIREHRGSTTVQLKKELEEMVSPLSKEGITKVPTIGFFDEIGAVLRRGDDSHYDNATTAEELGGFLEDQRHNKNFFFVATMNDGQTFLESMKNRMVGKIITFVTIIDPRHKVRLFQKKLVSTQIQLDDECDVPFLMKTIGALQEYSARDFRSLVDSVVDERMKDPLADAPLHIKKRHIQNALAKIAKDKEMLKCGEKIKTDYEQCEEQHKESIALQKQQHKENLDFQLFMQTHQRPAMSMNAYAGTNGIGISTTTTTASGIRKKAVAECKEKFLASQERSTEEQGLEVSRNVQENNNRTLIALSLAVGVLATMTRCTIQ